MTWNKHVCTSLKMKNDCVDLGWFVLPLPFWEGHDRASSVIGMNWEGIGKPEVLFSNGGCPSKVPANF